MKKYLIFSLSAIALSIGIANAQDYSKWSVAVKGGLDYYRVNPHEGQTDWSNMKTYTTNASWVLPVIQLEHTINPYFGIGVDFGHYAYNRHRLKGNTLDATIYGSVNLSNIIAPVRNDFWQKVTLYSNIGLGLGFYSFELDQAPKGKGKSPLGTVSLALEYNLGSSWALIGEGQYRSYTKENLGGIVSPDTKSNDAIVANIGLRYKFGAKSKTHTRNAVVKNYYSTLYGGDASDLATKAANDAAKANNKIDALEKSLNDRMNNIEKDNAAIKDKLNQLENALKELNSNPNSNASANISFDNIEFEFGSSKLTTSSHTILDQIASVLKANGNDKKVSIRVNGHTDSTGPEEYNQVLSEQRAESVKKYLVSKGVSESNISVKGYGESNPIASNDTATGRAQNRRVEFQISK